MKGIKALQRCMVVMACFLQMWGVSQTTTIQVCPDQNQVVFYKDVCLLVNSPAINFRYQLSIDPTFTKMDIDTFSQLNNICLRNLQLNRHYFWRFKEDNQPWRGIYTFATSKIRIDPIIRIDDVRLLSTVMLEKQWIVIDNPTNKTLDIKVFDKQSNMILHQRSDSTFKNIEIQDWPMSEYIFKITADGNTSETNIYIADVR